MNKQEIIDKLCEYARTKMSSKAKNPIIQFSLGAITVGVGKKMIEDKLSPILDFCTKPDGHVDVEGLKTSIMGGFETTGSVPVLNGIISLDVEDAKEFFSFIGCPVAAPAPTAATPSTPNV